jgi:hypothetical protein
MDPHTSADCFDSLSKGNPYVSQAECDKLFAQENSFRCETGKHWEPPVGNVCPQCITSPCPCGGCIPDHPLGEELSEAEKFCQEKTNSMDWTDIDPNPEKEDFYGACVVEQNALLYPEGHLEGTKIDPLTAGVGKDNMVMWVILAGATLWYLHGQGFFKKL